MMNHYALFANLQDRPCLVVGAGEVGARKARQLVESGAAVTIVALEVGSEASDMASRGELKVEQRAFEDTDVDGAMLVIAATSDDALNQRIFDAASARHTLCNVVDDGPRCTFILPALIRRGPVTIAISTAGYAPVLARWIKSRIERWLPARIGELASFANGWRAQVRRTLSTIDERRRLWETVFDGPVAEDVLAGRNAAAHRRMTSLLSGEASRSTDGEAWLVGAGPGDEGLITLRGYELLRKADVVLYDRLVAPGLLKFARVEAELIDVGKRAGQSHTQPRINELLVQHVREGKRVCRLKGGDAFVFGRGGEELDALDAHGLSYQVVPGVTAATACAAYAGIPLTDRAHSHGLVITTAHYAESNREPDWHTLTRSGHTLAFYMGARRIPQIADRLMQAGLPPETPYAIVEHGATPRQRVLSGTLGAVGAHTDVSAPAMLFVGEATRAAGRHAWFAPDRFNIPADAPATPTTGIKVAHAY